MRMTIPQGPGREMKGDYRPPIDPAKVKTYPMVWTTPMNEKSALMVPAIIAEKLFIKTSPDSELKVIEDVD